MKTSTPTVALENAIRAGGYGRSARPSPRQQAACGQPAVQARVIRVAPMGPARNCRMSWDLASAADSGASATQTASLGTLLGQRWSGFQYQSGRHHRAVLGPLQHAVVCSVWMKDRDSGSGSATLTKSPGGLARSRSDEPRQRLSYI